MRLVWRRSPVRVTLHEGISFQEATGAIRGAATTLGSALAVDAARKAERIGYVAPKELVPIQTELCAWRPFVESFPPVTK